ncbi:MAG: hypothetical protein A4E32_01659 [Methanomassiliicoccales archaeon PtaU1.Bin124]|nr:MAG: hypothetical protein A4E32_01659 [Methanomassiliicoccales archaeon PtaU1.Bin124]
MSSRADWVELEHGQVLELLPSGTTAEEAEAMSRRWNEIRAMGGPMPFVHGPGISNGRVGVIIDAPKGPDYRGWMAQNPYLWERMFDMLSHDFHEMHLIRMPELPSVVERMTGRINGVVDVDAQHKAKALKLLERNAGADYLMHWNYLPENIICTLEGPFPIKWEGCGRGPWLADLARSAVLLRLENDDYYRSNMVKGYLRQCNYTEDELNPWLGTVAMDKLADNVPEERDVLRSLVRRHLG